MKCFDVVKKIYFIPALAFVPCLLTTFLHIPYSGAWWELDFILMPLLFPILVIPFYLCYLEACAAVGRVTDGRLRTHGEIRLGYATTAVSVLLALSTVIIAYDWTSILPTAFSVIDALAYLALIVLWIVGAKVYNKRLIIKEYGATRVCGFPC